METRLLDYFFSLTVGAALLLAGLFISTTHATTIEGYTPAGTFQTVYVSTDGRLFVDVGGSFIPKVSSAATGQSVGQNAVSSTPAQCYPPDSTRTQGVIVNTSYAGDMWISGSASVSSMTGNLIGPRTMFSPDSPASFTGSLYCVSTGPLVMTYFYVKSQ